MLRVFAGSGWVARALVFTCLPCLSLAGEPARDSPGSQVVRECKCGAARCECGPWRLQETVHFRIYSAPEMPVSNNLASVCEELRGHLQQTWLGEKETDWTPKCVVVVHRSLRGYTARLGPGSATSSGCASIEFEDGKVSARRIDLRADAADWLSAALPHELTHVLLADHFSGRQPPRWADEGLAILAEPDAKRTQRFRAFEKGLARNATYSARDLLTLADYPDASRREAFYWQSASLVAYLAEREGTEKVLEFVTLALDRGYEPALKQVFGIASLADLDARWKPLLTAHDRPAPLAERVARITTVSYRRN